MKKGLDSPGFWPNCQREIRVTASNIGALKKAKHPTCRRCGGTFEVGSDIITKSNGKGNKWHKECAKLSNLI